MRLSGASSTRTNVSSMSASPPPSRRRSQVVRRYSENGPYIDNVPERGVGDFRHLIEESRLQRPTNPLHKTVQDANKGAVLADALDELGEPHAPFFRNLVHARYPDAWNTLETPHGNYRYVGTYPHPLHGRFGGENNTEWVTRETTSSEGGGGSALYVGRVENTPEKSGVTHIAVMHPDALREWANHPTISPSMRAHLYNVADHLDEQNKPHETKSLPMSRRRGVTVRSIKLSRLLSPEEVKPFVDAHRAGDRNALRALKDRFQDEGDPRGDVWDRHIGNTVHPGYAPHETGNTVTGKSPLEVGMGHYDNPNGGSHFVFNPVAKGQWPSLATDVAVSSYTSNGQPGRGTLSHSGVFAPEEARQLADKFPEEHAQNIHRFLDSHFGTRPTAAEPTPMSRRRSSVVRKYAESHPADLHLSGIVNALKGKDWTSVRDHARALASSNPTPNHVRTFHTKVLPQLLRTWSETAPTGAGSAWGRGTHDENAQRAIDRSLDALRGPMGLGDELFGPQVKDTKPLTWKPGIARPKPHLFSRKGLQGGLVAGVLKPTKKRGPNTRTIEGTALGALGDHLQELGSPLGAIVSHVATGGKTVPFSSLSGDTFDSVESDDGVHRVIGRHGKDRDGKPVVWVSVSQWKRVPLDNGNVRFDKDKSHDFAVPADAVKMSRYRDTPTLPKKVVRYAKAERERHPAHPLVAGFPIEHFLRHLANDSTNEPHVRDIAKSALTGKGHEGQDVDVPTSLWALHDALHETDHPMKSHYNLMSAADSVNTDAHTYHALTRLAEEAKFGVSPTNHSNWEYTPEHQAGLARRGMKRNSSEHPQIARRNENAYAFVRNHLAAAVPGISQKQIDASVRRHGYRAARELSRLSGHEQDTAHARALRHPNDKDGLPKSADHEGEVATRYRRLPVRRYAMEHMDPKNDPMYEKVNPSSVTANLKNRNFVRKFLPAKSSRGVTWGPRGIEPHNESIHGKWDHVPESGSLEGLPLSPQHLWAYGLPGGKAPEAPADEVTDGHGIPEYHGYGRKGPRRYMQDHTHADFHRKIMEDRNETTPDLVYADWLQEHGMEHTAAFVRHVAGLVGTTHVDSGGAHNGGRYLFENDRGPNQFTPRHPVSVGSVGWKVKGRGRPNRYGSVVSVKLPSDSGKHMLYWSQPISQEEAASWRTRMGPEHKEGLFRRNGTPRRYSLANRSNFLDALRRIRSSNQKAMHQTAQEVGKKLGLHPLKTLDALHDTPYGSVPGVAQAVYGNATPEQVHSAASWMGLTGNLPGVAVFHPRPTGPDLLHRVRVDGSMGDARARLDRYGLTNRVLIPHRKGGDFLIPDKGGKLSSKVEQFATDSKVPYETSPGHFSVVGSADQSQARESFRNTVTKQEQGAVQKSRHKQRVIVIRYGHVPFNSEIQGFIEGRKLDHKDNNNPAVLADWLEDHDDPRADIARRASDPIQETKFNPDGKRLYVKSHESYIPLTPEERTTYGLPRQSVRVHVYGILLGKERPKSRNSALERQRLAASVPIAVRLAFHVADKDRKSGAEYGGLFTREEAERLLDRFHPETATAVRRVISQGYGDSTSR